MLLIFFFHSFLSFFDHFEVYLFATLKENLDWNKIKMATSENMKNSKVNKSYNDVRRTWKSYSAKSTIHGVSYLSDEDTSGIEKFLWGFIIVLGLGFTIFQLIVLFEEREDSPTITTLNTSFYPVKDIKFPQVTICPQGSVNNLVERVLFKQLTNHIKENTFRPKGYNMPWNISKEEIIASIESFLEDLYPNVKGNPSEYVRLLASKKPQMTLEADVIMKEGSETSCDEEDDEAFLKNINGQLNARACQEGFELIDDHYCVHVSEQQMTFEETSSYCKEKGGEDLSITEINHAIQSTNLKEETGIFYVSYSILMDYSFEIPKFDRKYRSCHIFYVCI